MCPLKAPRCDPVAVPRGIIASESPFILHMVSHYMPSMKGSLLELQYPVIMPPIMLRPNGYRDKIPAVFHEKRFGRNRKEENQYHDSHIRLQRLFFSFLLRGALIWGEWENKPIKVNIVADAAFPAHSLIVEIIQEDGKLEKIVWSDWLLSSKNDLECYPSWFWEEDKCISCPTLDWLD